jgi:4-amino-4-deoxy-L-arabinose transferase-like glycosyltransferase
MSDRPIEPAIGGSLRLRTNRVTATALVLVVALFVGATVVWIRLDQALPLWDEAQYLMESELLFHTLQDAGPLPFLDRFSRTLGVKAPLITALPIPSYALLREGMREARYLNVVLVLVASWSLFRVGSAMAGPRAGILAVLFLNTFPLVAGLSRVVMVEYGLMTLVILSVHALVDWRGGAERGASWCLGVVFGLGLLMKVTFPLYVAAPALIVLGGDVVRHRRVRRELLASLARIAAVGVPIAAIWYSTNWRSVLGFVAQAGYGRLARDYSRGLGDYWRAVAGDGLGLVAVPLIVGLAAVASVQKARGGRLQWLARPDVLLLLAWALVPAVALSLAVTKDVRFAVPYFPAIALALGAGWSSVAGRHRLGLVSTLALAIASLAYYAWYSFASRRPPGQRLELLGVALPVGDGVWARPPQRERWPGESVVELVTADARALGLATPRVAVLFSHPSLNAHNLSYLAALRRSTVRFRTMHFQAVEPAAQLAREILEGGDYVLTKTGLLGGDRLNQTNLEVHALLVEEGFPFTPLAALALPDGGELILSRAESLGGNASREGVPLAPIPATARFHGAIALAKVGLECAPERCTLALAWRAAAAVREDYKVFVHVYDAEGGLVALADYYPGGARSGTSHWSPGDVVEERVMLPGPLGSNRIFVGWYRENPRWRLPLSGAATAWLGEPNALEIRAAP